jgi:hypothetical protein
LNTDPRSTATGTAAPDNDLHETYVHAVNSALAAGREHVARELADDYDCDRGVIAHEERRAA